MNNKMWHKAFFTLDSSTEQSPDMPNPSKSSFGSNSIPLKKGASGDRG